MRIDIQEQNAAAGADALVLSSASNIVAPAPRGGIPASVPADELLYWTEAWQAGEQETRRRLARGEGRVYPNAREVIRELLTND